MAGNSTNSQIGKGGGRCPSDIGTSWATAAPTSWPRWRSSRPGFAPAWQVRKKVAITSGKGGVGKSVVTANLAERAVRIDPEFREEVLRRYDEVLDDLRCGAMWRYGQRNSAEGRLSR